jgi:hypothetical protein
MATINILDKTSGSDELVGSFEVCVPDIVSSQDFNPLSRKCMQFGAKSMFALCVRVRVHVCVCVCSRPTKVQGLPFLCSDHVRGGDQGPERGFLQIFPASGTPSCLFFNSAYKLAVHCC